MVAPLADPGIQLQTISISYVRYSEGDAVLVADGVAGFENDAREWRRLLRVRSHFIGGFKNDVYDSMFNSLNRTQAQL